MKLNCVELSRNCAVGLLLMQNALCILVSLCTFGFAVVDMKVLQRYGSEYASGSLVGDIIIIAVSLLLLAVAIFGIMAAAKQHVTMLYLYMGLLMIMVVLELLVAIAVAMQRYGLEFKVKEWMRDDFYKNATGEELELHNRQWDELQINYECCGLDGPEDYHATMRQISLSCCPRAYRARTPHAQKRLYDICINSLGYNLAGCEDEVVQVLEDDADWLLGVAFICLWFEAAAMLLSMWLGNLVRNSVQVYKQTTKY